MENHTTGQPDNRPTGHLGDRTGVRQDDRTTGRLDDHVTGHPGNRTTQPNHRTTGPKDHWARDEWTTGPWGHCAGGLLIPDRGTGLQVNLAFPLARPTLLPTPAPAPNRSDPDAREQAGLPCERRQSVLWSAEQPATDRHGTAERTVPVRSMNSAITAQKSQLRCCQCRAKAQHIRRG